MEAIFNRFIWRDLLELAILTVLTYQVISMLKGTRAIQLLLGMMMIFAVYLLADMFDLTSIVWVIDAFASSLIIITVILFQDEIRRILLRFGRSPFEGNLEIDVGRKVVDETIKAVKTLSHERIGALIVFERSIGLDKLYYHGIPLDCYLSEPLLVSLFQSFSPLHDGAVIVRKNRILCASAQLPLTRQNQLSYRYGTRHSAGVGITEESDAVVVIVSEETGKISLALEGQMKQIPSIDTLKDNLIQLLLSSEGTRRVSTMLERALFVPSNLMSHWWQKQKNKKEPYAGPLRRMADEVSIVLPNFGGTQYTKAPILGSSPGLLKQRIRKQSQSHYPKTVSEAKKEVEEKEAASLPKQSQSGKHILDTPQPRYVPDALRLGNVQGQAKQSNLAKYDAEEEK